MISLKTQPTDLTGATWEKLNARFPEYDAIRRIERYSILDFMTRHRKYLCGDVLDFGAGLMPYKHLVSGTYAHFDKTDRYALAADKQYDCIMCNQVVQYVYEFPWLLAFNFRGLLKPNGYLVMTFPTNWDEVEPEDLHRFTATGMRTYLMKARFQVIEMERRAEVVVGNFRFPLGYGVIAQRQ